MTRYRVGLASAPISGFMVTYNKHTLGLEDLGTLEEQNWLNDQVRRHEVSATVPLSTNSYIDLITLSR